MGLRRGVVGSWERMRWAQRARAAANGAKSTDSSAMLMGTHTGMGMGAGMGMSMGMGTPADEFELGSHGLRALPPCSRSVQSRRLHHG